MHILRCDCDCVTAVAKEAQISKAISRPYSKSDSAYWTAPAKFAYLLPAEAGTHLINPNTPALSFEPQTNQAPSPKYEFICMLACICQFSIWSTLAHTRSEPVSGIMQLMQSQANQAVDDCEGPARKRPVWTIMISLP